MYTAEELLEKTLAQRTSAARTFAESIGERFDDKAEEAANHGEDWVAFPYATDETDVSVPVIDIAIAILKEGEAFQTLSVTRRAVAMKQKLVISWSGEAED